MNIFQNVYENVDNQHDDRAQGPLSSPSSHLHLKN